MGGEIPAQLTRQTKDQLRQICNRLREVIKPVVGYVGVDFFLPEGSEQPLVMELNPRLCSSYIGYRQATQTNLMSVVLGQVKEIVWNEGQTLFCCG
jgi:predicted ATP-grasp superfamily ATP-dependent carboligase